MLTLFAIPKPFRGHIDVIQRNAIHSWMCLQPRPQIILFGDDDGTAEVAQELGVHHVPSVARSELGTPLLHDVFAQAHRMATSDVLGYVNADIMLMSDFIQALQRVVRFKRQFLMVGRRWDLELNEPLDFDENWEEWLRAHVVIHGELHSIAAMDYFVFPRGIYEKIPPFTVGRMAWDNWMIHAARVQGVQVVDASRAVIVVHQNHDYAHVPHRTSGAWGGAESEQNLALASSYAHSFSLDDATWLMSRRWLLPALMTSHIRRRLWVCLTSYPRLKAWLARLKRRFSSVKTPTSK